jgi:hypothetical protein
MQFDSTKFQYVLIHFEKMFIDFDKHFFDIGYEVDSKIRILKSEIDIETPLKQPDRIYWMEKNIPVFYEEKPEKIIQYTEKQTIINIDLIKNAFLFLSGIIEFRIQSNRDEIGRYLYHGSFHEEHDILKLPVVNYYFSILQEAIEQTYKIQLKPKISVLTIGLTHDIDKCKSGWMEDGLFLLKKGRILNFIHLQIKKWVFGIDEWFNFRFILSNEKINNIQSTFFFLTQKGKQGKYSNADYSYKSGRLQKVYSEIISHGSEVGIHGSFGSSVTKGQFLNELNKLNKIPTLKEKIKGNRFHFLCWDQDLTTEIIKNSGLKYDMTAAYPDDFGFKTGFCFPSHYFNFNLNKAYNFTEVPLMLMDSTVLDKKYLDYNESKAIAIIEELISEIEKFNGIFTLLWHNTYYTNYKYSGNANLLYSIIKICQEKNAKFKTINQITEEWNQKK